jgi:hypothetical protein
MRLPGKAILLNLLLFGTSLLPKAMACDCGPHRSVEEEFIYAQLVIKGHIIATDTVSYLSAAYLDNGRGRLKAMISREYFLQVTVVVDTNYKSSTQLPDTIYVLTIQGNGSCDVYFPSYSYASIPGLPKDFYDFVIYGARYNYGTIVEKKQKKKMVKQVVTNYSANTFVTSSCWRTRRADPTELAALSRLKK